MTDYFDMPDFFEAGEQRCEDWYFDNVIGDEATCSCGKTFKLSEAEMPSPNPYAIPVCPDCFQEILKNSTPLPQVGIDSETLHE